MSPPVGYDVNPDVSREKVTTFAGRSRFLLHVAAFHFVLALGSVCGIRCLTVYRTDVGIQNICATLRIW